MPGRAPNGYVKETSWAFTLVAILRLQIIEVLLDLLEQAAGLLDEVGGQIAVAFAELTSRESWRKVFDAQ